MRVAFETGRTFLAEWMAEIGREPVWDPNIPKDCFELPLGETSFYYQLDFENFIQFRQPQLI